MTNKDKTGDQLVASIRKSKTGAVTRKHTERATAGSKATAANARRQKTAKTSKTIQNSGYSHGRRVWPD
jgi:hypothetical protein